MNDDRNGTDPARPGVTVVLGGGGFKGMAHIGVLMALEEAGVHVEHVVGTSAGALIGAAYVYAGDARTLHDLVVGFVSSDEFQTKGFVGFGAKPRGAGAIAFVSRLVTGFKRQVALERMFRRSSAFGGAALRYVVRGLVPNVQIEDLERPMAVAALDLKTGEEILLTEGPLCSAVCASSSVPGFFPPVERQGRTLVDAGIVNNLPTRAARALGAQRIVAVDLSASLAPTAREDVGMDILLRAQDISIRLANRRWADHADVIVNPGLDGRNWLDASGLEEVIDAGASATRARLDEILALVDEHAGARRGVRRSV